MDRTFAVTISDAAEDNAAAWLVRAEVSLLVDGRSAPSRKTGTWTRAFTIAPGAREVTLRVTVQRPELRWSMAVEQTFAGPSIDAGAPQAVRSNGSWPSQRRHPRVSVRPGGAPGVTAVDVDLKVVDITAAILARAPIGGITGAAPPIRYYEVTSGRPRAWLAVGPLGPAREDEPPSVLTLLAPSVDPFLDALGHASSGGLEARFNRGWTRWYGAWVFYDVTLGQASSAVSTMPDARSWRTSSTLLLAASTLSGGAPEADAGQLRDRPEGILRSLLDALWADGVIPADGGPLASTRARIARDGGRAQHRVAVAWPDMINTQKIATLKPYTLRRGDHLQMLSFVYGFDVDEVWSDPRNEAIRKLRPNPGALQPGDVVFLPRTSAEPTHPLPLMMSGGTGSH